MNDGRPTRAAPTPFPRERRPRKRRWLCAALLAGPLGGTVGCAGFNERPAAMSATHDVGYESALLTYRLDAGRLSVPLATSRIEGQLVSYTEQVSPPTPGTATGELRIHVPHPLGKPGVAQAELILENDAAAATGVDVGWSGWWRGAVRDIQRAIAAERQPAGYHEVWTLDIPRAEFDALCAKLEHQGLYEFTAAAAPGIELALKKDGVEIRKQWGQASELDGLMHRIRNQGQLVSYHRPPSPVSERSPGPTPSSSVLAYEAAFPGPAAASLGISSPQTSDPTTRLVRLPTPPRR